MHGWQNKRIHGLLHSRGLSLESGRDIAARVNGGRRSLSACDPEQANAVIRILEGGQTHPSLEGMRRKKTAAKNAPAPRIYKEASEDVRRAVRAAGAQWRQAGQWANWAHKAGYEDADIAATLTALVRLQPAGSWWPYAKKTVSLLRVRRLEQEHEERKKAPVGPIVNLIERAKIKGM